MCKRNVFLAMGFAPEDAMVLALRSDLAAAIARYLKEEGIGQREAIAKLGLPQGTVSNIMRGKTDHLSIERLMRAMVRAELPGYALWPSADSAKAGCLPSASRIATITGDVDIDYGRGVLATGSGWQPEAEVA